MDNRKISIIIPIYRTEDYLRECLESVRNQTYPHFEALLVNDATPDHAMDIANEFAREDERFRIIEHKENKGLGAARNTGIDHAKGDYLFFLDSDDQLPVDSLETLVSLAEETNADMVVGNMAWVEGKTYLPVRYINNKIKLWEELENDNRRLLRARFSLLGSVCHRLFKKSLINENQIRFSEGIYWEDVIFSIKSWIFSRLIVSTNKYVYYRRERKDQSNLSITQMTHSKLLIDRDTLLDNIYHVINDNYRDYYDAINLGLYALFGTLNKSRSLVISDGFSINNLSNYCWFVNHLLKGLWTGVRFLLQSLFYRFTRAIK
jgi:glycosyltransferase involved in cell wall biosynthesis